MEIGHWNDRGHRHAGVLVSAGFVPFGSAGYCSLDKFGEALCLTATDHWMGCPPFTKAASRPSAEMLKAFPVATCKCISLSQICGADDEHGSAPLSEAFPVPLPGRSQFSSRARSLQCERESAAAPHCRGRSVGLQDDTGGRRFSVPDSQWQP